MATRRSGRARAAQRARRTVKKSTPRRSASRKGGASRVRERRQRTPETLRLREFQPSLTVADIERSIRFYSDVLGFIVGERWTDDKGALRGVMLKAGTCQL